MDKSKIDKIFENEGKGKKTILVKCHGIVGCPNFTKSCCYFTLRPDMIKELGSIYVNTYIIKKRNPYCEKTVEEIVNSLVIV